MIIILFSFTPLSEVQELCLCNSGTPTTVTAGGSTNTTRLPASPSAFEVQQFLQAYPGLGAVTVATPASRAAGSCGCGAGVTATSFQVTLLYSALSTYRL